MRAVYRCEARNDVTQHGVPHHVQFKRGRFYYYFARDSNGWYQITAAGNRHKATAEQVLNHVLPALAKVKPGATVTVEHVPDSTSLTPES